MKGAKKDDREQTRELLKTAGLRVTSSRTAVINVLRGADTPLSHADVAARLEQQGLDRTTVYRNLVDLAEAGILRRSDVGHIWRFELAGGSSNAHDSEQHPHFVCTDCGKVSCLPSGSIAIKALRGAPSALRKGGDLEIQIRGQCDACA
ncbi:MAG: transcriptional repressor [Myxococcales bacterium]